MAAIFPDPNQLGWLAQLLQGMQPGSPGRVFGEHYLGVPTAGPGVPYPQAGQGDASANLFANPPPTAPQPPMMPGRAPVPYPDIGQGGTGGLMAPIGMQPGSPAPALPPPTDVGYAPPIGGAPAAGSAPGMAMAPVAPQAVPSAPQGAAPPVPSARLFPTAQPATEPDLLSRINAFGYNWNAQPGNIGLIDAIRGAQTGVRTDPQGVAMQAMQSTYQALRQAGIPDGVAQAAALNPEVLKTIAPQLYQKPTLVPTGTDPLTGQITHGVFDPNKLSLTPPVGTAPAGQPGVAPGLQSFYDAKDRGVTGEALIKLLPKTYQDYIRNVINYKQNPQTLSVAKGVRDQIMTLAAAVDPTYDQSQYATRAAAIKEFNTGGTRSPAGTITAGNTAIGHLADAYKVQQDLGGTSSLGPLNYPANVLTNWWNKASDNPKLNAYNSWINKLAEEMTTFYRQGGGNESDINRELATLSPYHSQEAREAAFKVLAPAMQSKVEALQSRYKTAMGPTGWMQAAGDAPREFNIIQEKSRKALDYIARGAQPEASTPAGGAQSDAIAEARRRGLIP